MAELDFNNILGAQDVDTWFEDPEDSETVETVEEKNTGKEPEDKENKVIKTTEVDNPNELFEEEEVEEKQPESVGSGKEEEKDKEDTSADNSGGASPQNFYSSIANAMAVDGIFPNLDEETVKKASDAESFSDLIEKEVTARLDEKQQRISKALDNGVEPDILRRFENTLQYVNSITDTQLSDESEKGENLRRDIIFQDFLNKGYSREKAQKFTERTIDAGTDVEDAKEALQSNKEFFQEEYSKLLKEAQDRANYERAERNKQAEKLKESILKDKYLFGDMGISNDVRKKVIDNISRPTYRDPDTGEYLTALQKYELEHRGDFLKYAGLLFTLTDGFKDFESFTKGKVKKEVKKGLRELEQTLNNTRRNADGSLRMVTNGKEDPESFIAKGMKLNI